MKTLPAWTILSTDTQHLALLQRRQKKVRNLPPDIINYTNYINYTDRNVSRKSPPNQPRLQQKRNMTRMQCLILVSESLSRRRATRAKAHRDKSDPSSSFLCCVVYIQEDLIEFESFITLNLPNDPYYQHWQTERSLWFALLNKFLDELKQNLLCDGRSNASNNGLRGFICIWEAFIGSLTDYLPVFNLKAL